MRIDQRFLNIYQRPIEFICTTANCVYDHSWNYIIPNIAECCLNPMIKITLKSKSFRFIAFFFHQDRIVFTTFKWHCGWSFCCKLATNCNRSA